MLSSVTTTVSHLPSAECEITALPLDQIVFLTTRCRGWWRHARGDCMLLQFPHKTPTDCKPFLMTMR